MRKHSSFTAAAILVTAGAFGLGAFVTGSIGFSSSALAQAVEQHPAPIIRGDKRVFLPEPALKGSNDATPLGVDLRRLIIVDHLENGTEHPPVDGPGGIILSHAGALLQDPAFKARLDGYLGQPLSAMLISDIRIAITEHFRRIDRPLVAINTPPQEVSAGTLRLDVLPFRVGALKIEGGEWTPDAHIADTVRLKQGDTVDSSRLIADLNWLNANPYRNLGVVFEPGDKPGTANVILRSKEAPPYSAWGGYATSGSRNDDPHRFFVGASIANLPWIDHQLSYQLTSSPQNGRRGRVLSLHDKPGYLSHAVTYLAPIDYGDGIRHTASLQASYVQSFVDLIAPFTQDNTTLQLYGEYAVPLNAERQLGKDLSLEVYGALDFKRQRNEVFFAGVSQLTTTLDIFQFALGARGGFRTPFGIDIANEDEPGLHMGGGNARFDLRLAGSPGDVTRFNDDVSFAAANNNPNASAHYGYFYGSFNHAAPLPKGFALATDLTFQLAERPLPGLEQFSYGGQTSVRGYLSNEASGDHGVTIQNAIEFPAFSFLDGDLTGRDAIRPYVFGDYGYSIDRLANDDAALMSAGFGFDYQFGETFSATVQYGHAFKAGGETQDGASHLYGSVSIRF